jgi:NADH-quinone oxidoreductase subunit L
MLALIPLLPFVGFLVNAGMGSRVSKKAAGGVACGAMLASFVLSLVVVRQLIAQPPESRALVQSIFSWITSGDFSVDLALRLDPLASLMILVVSGIGSLIHVYSTAYMHEETDAEYARYFSYLNLFAAFMLVLVLGSNFLVMFIGWEGVGLCSYLLIGFWYEKKSASDAGKKAFIVNRIGDFGFILGVLLAFVRFGTLDFQAIARSVATLRPESGFGTLSLITLLLFVGATGKSAQIPLYVWLPDAMEGPTPVSALIHAATMVTAGVYLIGRNAVLFSHAPFTLAVVAVIGVATALMAGTIGLVQNDIKRVLAYSTVSQLGYMFLAMGVGAYAAGIFHLYTHAFFKALLFLGSGAVIHALAGEQDLRRMGGLKKDLPITYWTFLIGALAITGVPGLAGFFSKDEILYRTFAGGHVLLWVVGLLTSLLTAVYMFRLVFLAFHGERASTEHLAPSTEHLAPGTGHPTPHLHDAPPAMAVALVVLAVGAIAAGYIGLPTVLGGSRLEKFLEPSFTAATGVGAVGLGNEEVGASTERLEVGLMAVSTLVALGGIAVAGFFFLGRKQAAETAARRFEGLHRLLSNKYYVDELYDAALVRPIRIASEEGLWKGVDVNGIDALVNGAGSVVRSGSDVLRQLQTGSVRTYAASLFVGVVVILGYYLWR